jgi:hypothetical protein
MIVMFYPSMRAEMAIGWAAIAGGLMESAFCPWFWMSFVVFLTAFYLTGNLTSKAFRVLFFWVPTVLACVVGLRLWTLFCVPDDATTK